ncbi:hypothetical protein D6C90_07453 [Aureobasidium pullulans]|uniref:Uncharacterized protein n=1 Tax=Aureobasidium pullulans TaxID=5580 RepID=A0A4S9UCB7_AURPU|nr:hypothetical protein D6C90_07453 [Aureobasidium pullulans]
MGLKSYFRKPANKDVEPSEMKDTVSGSLTPWGLTSHTPMSQESSGAQDVAMQRLNDARSELMVNHLWSQQAKLFWYAQEEDEGVVIKQSRGSYVCCPPDLCRPDGFFDAISALNVKSAMTVNTRLIRLLIQGSDQSSIPISGKLRLQVLPDVSYLSRCAKHQSAAFIADRGILVVWDDQPENLISRAQALEKSIMDMIWNMNTEQEFSEKGNKSNGVSVREVDITVTIWVSFFFFQALIGNIFQMFGPISQVQSNTKYYSSLPPKRLMGGPLPHVTIQCPVYKEGLQSVIAPTVFSIKAAISTYEMQGGTANIFINDDGMQLLSREEAQARQDFYEEHSIGWVARPRHDPKGEHNPVPFVRRGKFKKASNMNYALWVSNRVEDKMMQPSPRPLHWNQEQEAALYVKALYEVIEEDENQTWADGNVRMGDFILLIDSDTRVPTDCLLDAVSEMTNSPQVAILQYSSRVMNVTKSYFENGITFFTNMVYTQIKYAIANGDVAPFVGHNAILRWSAVQDIAYDCTDDLREKYWSEATVSEDFDMALRLQSAGYLVRFGAYMGDGFKEGVSLTVYDELAR